MLNQDIVILFSSPRLQILRLTMRNGSSKLFSILKSFFILSREELVFYCSRSSPSWTRYARPRTKVDRFLWWGTPDDWNSSKNAGADCWQLVLLMHRHDGRNSTACQNDEDNGVQCIDDWSWFRHGSGWCGGVDCRCQSRIVFIWNCYATEDILSTNWFVLSRCNSDEDISGLPFMQDETATGTSRILSELLAPQYYALDIAQKHGACKNWENQN